VAYLNVLYERLPARAVRAERKHEAHQWEQMSFVYRMEQSPGTLRCCAVIALYTQETAHELCSD
jgi:hypothetical protein